MIRPQLKDIYQSGMDARMVGMEVKKAKLPQPPMNASPGELRLWRKLNGMLSEDEKRVDDFEHGKARSRQHAYPGTRGSAAKRRPSEAEQLYGTVPKASATTPAVKKSKASTGSSQANSPRSASPHAGSTKNLTPANRSTAPMRALSRNDTPIRSQPAPKPPHLSLQQSKQKHSSPRMSISHLPPKAPKVGGEPLKAYKVSLEDESVQHLQDHKQSKQQQQQHRRPQLKAAPISHEQRDFQDEQHEAAHEEMEDEPSYPHSAKAALDDDLSQCEYDAAPAEPGNGNEMDDNINSDHPQTPSPVATGDEPEQKAKRRQHGADSSSSTMKSIENLIHFLSLSDQKKMHARLGEMIEMAELRAMIDRVAL